MDEKKLNENDIEEVTGGGGAGPQILMGGGPGPQILPRGGGPGAVWIGGTDDGLVSKPTPTFSGPEGPK